MDLRARLLAAALAIWVATAIGCAGTPPTPVAPPASSPAAEPADTSALELLGEALLPVGASLRDAPVGGLSAITYDVGRRVYYALSDDGSERAPARFYTLSIDLSDGRLTSAGVAVLGVTFLTDRGGYPFPRGGLDPEGLVLAPDADTLYFASEGAAARRIPPFVRKINLDGQFRRELRVPEAFLPGPGVGVRDNLAFESLTMTPDGRWLLTATENALVQDGPKADFGVPSPARILRFDARTGEADGQFVYEVGPVVGQAAPAGIFRVNGLSELLAVDDGRLLALERSYVQGREETIRLYEIRLAGATDVAGLPALAAAKTPVRPVGKELLLDLSGLPVRRENSEGMTWGPELPDGRRTLVLVSDDNFDPLGERTQILAFAVAPDAL